MNNTNAEGFILFMNRDRWRAFWGWTIFLKMCLFIFVAQVSKRCCTIMILDVFCVILLASVVKDAVGTKLPFISVVDPEFYPFFSLFDPECHQ